MPSAAPISGFGLVRVDTVSLGGTVKERFMATRRGVFSVAAEEEFDMLLSRVLTGSMCYVHATQTSKGLLPVAML